MRVCYQKANRSEWRCTVDRGDSGGVVSHCDRLIDWTLETSVCPVTPVGVRTGQVFKACLEVAVLSPA